MHISATVWLRPPIWLPGGLSLGRRSGGPKCRRFTLDLYGSACAINESLPSLSNWIRKITPTSDTCPTFTGMSPCATIPAEDVPSSQAEIDDTCTSSTEGPPRTSNAFACKKLWRSSLRSPVGMRSSTLVFCRITDATNHAMWSGLASIQASVSACTDPK